MRHKFRTLMQSVIGLSAVLAQINSEKQIDFLHERSAMAIETLQHLAWEKNYTVTIQGRQNLQTYEMDRTSLKFLELFDYNAAYSDEYLDKLVPKAASAWQNVVDVDGWLNTVRYGTHV